MLQLVWLLSAVSKDCVTCSTGALLSWGQGGQGSDRERLFAALVFGKVARFAPPPTPLLQHFVSFEHPLGGHSVAPSSACPEAPSNLFWGHPCPLCTRFVTRVALDPVVPAGCPSRGAELSPLSPVPHPGVVADPRLGTNPRAVPAAVWGEEPSLNHIKRADRSIRWKYRGKAEPSPAPCVCKTEGKIWDKRIKGEKLRAGNKPRGKLGAPHEEHYESLEARGAEPLDGGAGEAEAGN